MSVGLHLFELTYWELNGSYYCNDIKNFKGHSAKWYVPMRILDLSVEDYIDLLINKFDAKNIKYNRQTDCLLFHFSKESNAKNYCSYINKKAKAMHYYCK